MGLIVEERKGAVMVWTLTRPDRLNALPDLEDGEAFASACEAVNADRKIGRNIGMRYHDGEPSLIEGLLARGDRRVGAEMIERDRHEHARQPRHRLGH